jgi:hypothetical protein
MQREQGSAKDRADGKPQGGATRAATVALYSDEQLEQLQKDLGSGPTGKVIKRLIANLRDARWKLTELEAEKQHNDEIRQLETTRSRHRVLVVVELDGYGHIYADESASIRVIEVYPWQDSHEMMLNEKGHWSDIWSPGMVRKTFRPHYVTEPNGVSLESLSNVLKWQSNIELLSKLREVEARAKP